MSWTEMQPVLADRLNKLIESKPEVLLECDGGPMHVRADIIIARLIGMDGQVDATWRIPKVVDTLLRPVVPSVRSMMAEGDPSALSMPHEARYVLQSAWAQATLDWTRLHNLLPGDVRPAHGSSAVTIALLRYRHRI